MAKLKLGLVYNQTDVSEHIGSFEVPGKSYGRVPQSHIDWLLKQSVPNALVPIEGNPEREIFTRTPNLPFNPRYTNA